MLDNRHQELHVVKTQETEVVGRNREFQRRCLVRTTILLLVGTGVRRRWGKMGVSGTFLDSILCSLDGDVGDGVKDSCSED